MGINIKEIEQGIFLFQFYHKDDMNWVLRGGPWSFDNSMLVIAEVPKGEEPLNVPLWYLNMWIQIYGLPSGIMTEVVGRQLGNFFGEFLEYDHKNNTSNWREYMRIKVKIDVRKPLKRRKKITRRNGAEVLVTCKYERLGDFCFTCGIISHTERYCRQFLNRDKEDINREWGSWLRAQPRRNSGTVKSKWLREDDDANWEDKQGRVKVNPGSKEGGVSGVKTPGNQLSTGGDNNTQVQIIREESFPLQMGDNTTVFQGGNFQGGNKNTNFHFGPEENELDGLQLTERKRMRGGPDQFEVMDTEGGLRLLAGTNMTQEQPTNMEAQNEEVQVSKNEEMAGVALQPCQSL